MGASEESKRGVTCHRTGECVKKPRDIPLARRVCVKLEIAARDQSAVANGRFQLLPKLSRYWIVLYTRNAHRDMPRIGVRTERHIPKRKHGAVVRIAERGVGVVMDAVELRRDDDAMHERRNLETDVRVPDEPRDRFGDEMPIDQRGRRAEQ